MGGERLGRPVKWISGRTETFQCDPHGRDHVTRAEMAFDASGRTLAVRIRTMAAMGAYLQDFGPRVPTVAGGRILGTVYDVQALNAQVSCVFTNTTPTDAYRGAGRPEQAYVLERLYDLGAAEFGIGRDEIRRRNYIRPEQIPYTNVVGNAIDSGLFAETQAKAQALADWAGFPARGARPRRRRASGAASASATSSRPRAASPANGRGCDSIRMAASPSPSAPSAMARGTRRPMRRSCTRSSAWISTRCG